MHEATCVFNGKVCTWKAGHSGRLPLQERADSSHRVDPSQGHTDSDLSIRGNPPHTHTHTRRSVRHEAEQSTSGICFSIPRSTGMVCGRYDPLMGGLCIPPNSTSDEGACENGERNMFGHPHSPMLGKSCILSDASFPVGCSSNQDSNSGGSFDPTSLPSFSSEAGILQPARLAVLQGGLENAGFSKESAKGVCAAKRSSTQSLYNSHWINWIDWCLEWEMDPINPSVTTMADFLIFLFEEKKLLPASIKGFKSAIASTLKHLSSVDLSYHQVLSDIIKSMELEKPVISRVVTHWDLSLVLDSLKKFLFEPMSSCSLKCLTQKTVFLIALTSGRRRSELHALSATPNSVKFSTDKSSVELHFYPVFSQNPFTFSSRSSFRNSCSSWFWLGHNIMSSSCLTYLYA